MSDTSAAPLRTAIVTEISRVMRMDDAELIADRILALLEEAGSTGRADVEEAVRAVPMCADCEEPGKCRTLGCGWAAVAHSNELRGSFREVYQMGQASVREPPRGSAAAGPEGERPSALQGDSERYKRWWGELAIVRDNAGANVRGLLESMFAELGERSRERDDARLRLEAQAARIARMEVALSYIAANSYTLPGQIDFYDVARNALAATPERTV